MFSNATLHWVKDHVRLLQNVYLALLPGGRLRFNFAGDRNCSNFFSIIKEAMVRWIDQPCFVPFVAHVPDPAKDSFRSCVVNKMLEVTKQNDGTCFETFRRINISATK